jgi:hypothetical protein
MLTHKHALISAAIGVIGWWRSGDPVTFVAALAAGTLPDVDHVVDYAYLRRYSEHRLILPLHGYEYALLGGGLALAAGNLVVQTAVISYLIHLLADQRENQTHPLGYSLLFRAWRRFRIEAISSVPEAAIRGREEDLRLLSNLLRPQTNRC